MKFFLDSADVAVIEHWYPTGIVDGVTTNPSLIAKSGQPLHATIAKIAAIAEGDPVSAEVVATDHEGMLREATALSQIAQNVVIKLPMTPDGMSACRDLRARDIRVNVTLVFSLAQALIAAKCGASFVSPFVGRLDDHVAPGAGMQLIDNIVTAYDQYDYDTEVLVASVRSRDHIEEAAVLGADIVTLPPKILGEMYQHPLTDKGLEAFLRDWKESQK
ncbi:MAG: fructose-6-phosphate aldolase [Alphaproteobacteria bacterium]|nr:fructose-6-phosphate aldolase [Alphaproteobacteria bacterium]